MQIRDERRLGHFWADNEVYDIFVARIGVHAFAVYMALCKYVNQQAACNPSFEEIARKLAVSRRTVIRAMATLAEHKLVRVEHVKITKNGKPFNSSNIYTLLDVKSRPDLVTNRHHPSDYRHHPSDSQTPP